MTLFYQLGDASYQKGIYGVIAWFAVGILYFALVGRHKLILSPEEEFAMSKGTGGVQDALSRDGNGESRWPRGAGCSLRRRRVLRPPQSLSDIAGHPGVVRWAMNHSTGNFTRVAAGALLASLLMLGACGQTPPIGPSPGTLRPRRYPPNPRIRKRMIRPPGPMPPALILQRT